MEEGKFVPTELVIGNKVNTLAVMSCFLVITSTLNILALFAKFVLSSYDDDILIMKWQLVYIDKGTSEFP